MQTTPDKMGIRIITPGGSVSYEIPVMKLQRYVLEEIFEKELLFLIPFYIFSHESRFMEYNKDTTKMEPLLEEYEKIKNHLEELLNTMKTGK